VCQVTSIREDVRCQNSGGARATSELHDEFLGRTMRRPPGVAFVRHDLLIDEGLDPRGCQGAGPAPTNMRAAVAPRAQLSLAYARIIPI
jgi:hypothetical protein